MIVFYARERERERERKREIESVGFCVCERVERERGIVKEFVCEREGGRGREGVQ